MAANVEEIRRAILKNRGGFKDATNAQIMALWHELDCATQIQYLQSIKEAGTKSKGKKDAVNSGSKKDVSGSP